MTRSVGRHGAGVPARDRLPVAQADDAVGDLADLVEAVGDVDDARALVAQHALGLRAAQRRRRLVEDDATWLAGDRLGDLDLLLHGHREAADRTVRVDVGAEEVEHSCDSSYMRWRSMRPPLRGSLPRKMFSANVSSGRSRISWWMSITPAASASPGVAGE
jgi:hypothetical protein